MTILADRAQTLDREQHDVLRFLPKIFGRDIRIIIMNTSYRNTWEIATYAGKISGITDVELLERHGKEVEEKSFATEEQMLQKIAEQSSEALNRKDGKFETAAVITMTEEGAFDIYRLLRNR